MAILIKNASQILTMTDGLGIIKDCSILIDEGVVKTIGKVAQSNLETIDCRGCVVCPGFVDSHTHLVFAGTREDEFAIRIIGTGYEKIASEGGGIVNTVKKTRTASEDELFKLSQGRIKKIVAQGTTTLEIKSGYGLSTKEELKLLQVIRRLKDTEEIDIIPTFLAHAIPHQMRHRDYTDLIIEEMLPKIAKDNLAEFCDVFCERTAFTKRESERILLAAKKIGFNLKIHADELSNSGGARLAAKLGCISADHLIYTTTYGIKALKKANVIPTLLPGTSLFLGTKKKPNLKAFKKLNLNVAIASDFNPGTCMVYSMPKIISLACLLYRMEIEDALRGATINGARALTRADKIGSIEDGKSAELVVLSVDNYKKIPYQFGEDMVNYTIKRGKVIYAKNR
jgi:imidazolonepropionase